MDTAIPAVMSIDDSGTVVIDRAVIEPSVEFVQHDVVAAPLAACAAIVISNERADGRPSQVVIDRIDCEDLGRSDEGDELSGSEPSTLRTVPNWHEYYGGRGRSMAERLRSARYAQLTAVKPMRWLEGLTIWIQPNDDLSRAVYISGQYEPATLLLLRRLLRPGATFVDVGANAGLYSLLAARWIGDSGRVHAFEPSAREFERLEQHLQVNDIRHVTAWRYAIGHREGSIDLRVAARPNAGHNTVGNSFAYSGVAMAKIDRVAVTTLDAWAANEKVDRIDVVKMDIEGAEAAALDGAANVLTHFRPAWLTEVSAEALRGCGSTPAAVFERFMAAGYTLHTIDDAGGIARASEPDAIGSGNFLALPTECSLD